MAYQLRFESPTGPLKPDYVFTGSLIQFQRRRMLVVEDDRELWAVLHQTILAVDSSVSVDFVETAEEALDRLVDDKPYDLVLVDILLAGQQNGYWLRERCAEFQPWAIFAMTSSMPLARLGGPECPFLRKPYSPEDCLRFLRDLIL